MPSSSIVWLREKQKGTDMRIDLGNPKNTIEIIQKYNFAFQKKFGQNFLIDTHVLSKIITAAGVTKDDMVLEIGPGIGTMTQYLAENAGRVVAVEIDSNLIPILEETLKDYDNITIINEDILKLDINKLAQEYNGGRPIKVVANLPYYITTPIIMGLFESGVPIDNITVMVQKEVADRMAASPGTKNYGAYTVKLRLYAEPAGRFAVGPGNFFPPPRVESAVLRLNRRPVFDDQGVPLDADAIGAACTMAEAAFATRRKTLSNSCKTYFAGRGPQGAAVIARLPQLFERAGIDPRLRGEVLDLPEFVRLGRAFQQIG